MASEQQLCVCDLLQLRHLNKMESPALQLEPAVLQRQLAESFTCVSSDLYEVETVWPTETEASNSITGFLQ